MKKTVELTVDKDAGIVEFTLSSGIPVVLKEPKARQMLLLNSFMQQCEPEYKSDYFLAAKLASLCISKWGKEPGISFDTLVDSLSLQELNEVVTAVEHFRDSLGL